MSIQPAGFIPEWTIGDRLRKAREATGLSQAQLAKAIDVSPKTVGNYEAGRVETRRIVLRAWSLRTGVPLMWLETGEAPSPEGNGASDGAPYQNRTGDLFITSRTVRGAEQVVSIDRRRREAAPLVA